MFWWAGMHSSMAGAGVGELSGRKGQWDGMKEEVTFDQLRSVEKRTSRPVGHVLCSNLTTNQSCSLHTRYTRARFLSLAFVLHPDPLPTSTISNE